MSPSDTDPDDELATLAVSEQEDGATFSLKRETWSALASAAMSVNASVRTIRRPRPAGKGCVVDLFGRHMMLSLSVDPESGITLDRQPLDSPEPIRVLEASDDRTGWRRVKAAMTYLLGSRK